MLLNFLNADVSASTHINIFGGYNGVKIAGQKKYLDNLNKMRHSFVAGLGIGARYQSSSSFFIDGDIEIGYSQYKFLNPENNSKLKENQTIHCILLYLLIKPGIVIQNKCKVYGILGAGFNMAPSYKEIRDNDIVEYTTHYTYTKSSTKRIFRLDLAAGTGFSYHFTQKLSTFIEYRYVRTVSEKVSIGHRSNINPLDIDPLNQHRITGGIEFNFLTH